MGEHDGDISKLTERSENANERIKKLEDNQRWGVITMLALIAKAAFDYMTKGSAP